MRYYHLNQDVYIVEGNARSAIYDLRQGELYSISQRMNQLIRSALSGLPSQFLPEEDQALIDQLVENTVLLVAETPGKYPDIKQELKKDYFARFSFIEVTRQCNMTCTFCYEESTPHCHERMTLDDFKILLGQLKEANIRQIQFIGGEPLLLREELKAMILLARPFMNFIEVYTNGILINQEWCEFFKENKINVAISMHSYLAEEHDKIVNLKGAHKKLLKAYHCMKEHGIKPRVGGIRDKDIKQGTPEQDFPIKIRFDNPRLTGRADASQYDFEMFKEKAITKETKRAPIKKTQVSLHVNAHQCFSKDIYVATDLTVYPCVMERRINYGNLKNGYLPDFLKNPFRQLTKDDIEGCNMCEYRYACFDCRPDANSRGIYQKPWFCSYDPKHGEWAELATMFASIKNSTSKLLTIPIVVESI